MLVCPEATCGKLFGSSTHGQVQLDMNNIFGRITHRPQAWRKKILLCCRAQHIPPLGGRPTRIQVQCGFTYPLIDDYDDDTRSLLYFLRQYEKYITSPFFASLIINILLAAPYLSQEKNRVIKEGWEKEILVMGSEAFPSAFNYDVWFDPEMAGHPFSPDLQPNRRCAEYIHQLLHQWKISCSHRTFYPRASSKSMARSTMRAVSEFLGYEWDAASLGEFTQRRLLEIQHIYGRRFEGPCEIRQKWYRSQLGPRTYFAMGGSAFNCSKHGQDMANDLVNSLTSTEYINRLNPTRLRVDSSDENLCIWDLWCFTSNHHESRHFLLKLADFCHGTEITIVDEVEGVVTRDLGVFLSEYSQMNCFPEYTLERCDEFYTELISFHNVAGFLGVYGNLPFSTFLHGASVLQAVGDPDKLNVAGDDGHTTVEPGTDKDRDIQKTIRRNGVIEEQKMFWSYEDGAVCLKRGLVQIGNRLFQKEMIIWPSIALILECSMGSKMPDHNRPPFLRSLRERRAAVAIELMRFAQSVHLHAHLDLDLEYIASFIRNVFTLCGLPQIGSVPQLGGQYLCPQMPRDGSYFLNNPLTQVIAYHYSGIVSLPFRGEPEECGFSEFANVAGWEWYCHSSSKWTFFKTLGYLVEEPVTRMYFDLDGYDRLVKEFETYLPSVVKMTVVDAIPSKFAIQ